MIHRPIIASLLAIAFASTSPAQKVDQKLRAKLAELAKENAELRAQNRALKNAFEKRRKPAAVKGAPRAGKKRVAADARKVALEQKKIQADLARIQEALAQAKVRARGRAGGARWRTIATPNPLHKGDYQKALAELQKIHQRIRSTQNLEDAMKAIDEANQILLRARGALWKQKQASKTDGKTSRNER